MDKNTKITLAELIKRKEQVLEAKKSPKKARIYVKSLDGEIIIKAPTKSLATEAAEMENDGDAHLVYECVAEPDIHARRLHLLFLQGRDSQRAVLQHRQDGFIG